MQVLKLLCLLRLEHTSVEKGGGGGQQNYTVLMLHMVHEHTLLLFTQCTSGLGSGHSAQKRGKYFKKLHDSMERTNATHYWLVKRA